MVNLTHGTPPFTVQIEDEGSNVLEQVRASFSPALLR